MSFIDKISRYNNSPLLINYPVPDNHSVSDCNIPDEKLQHSVNRNWSYDNNSFQYSHKASLTHGILKSSNSSSKSINREKKYQSTDFSKNSPSVQYIDRRSAVHFPMKGFDSTIDPPSEPTQSIPIKNSTYVELVVIHATDNITFNGVKKLMSKKVKCPILQMYNINWFENDSPTKYSLILSDGHHYVQATCNSKVHQQCQLLGGTKFALIRIVEYCVQYYSNKYILDLTDISVIKNDLPALVGTPAPFTIKKSSTDSASIVHIPVVLPIRKRVVLSSVVDQPIHHNKVSTAESQKKSVTDQSKLVPLDSLKESVTDLIVSSNKSCKLSVTDNVYTKKNVLIKNLFTIDDQPFNNLDPYAFLIDPKMSLYEMFSLCQC